MIAMEAPEDVAAADDHHKNTCRCLACGCASWLRAWPADEVPPGEYPDGVILKIATVGIGGSGTVEPDHAFDALITELDFQRALRLVPTQFLTVVGETARATKAPYHGSRDKLIIGQLEGSHRTEWSTARMADLGGAYTVEQDERHPAKDTLHRLIDQCAMEMALVMGERHSGRPRRPLGRVEPLPPYEAEIPKHKRWPLSSEQLARKTQLQRTRRKQGRM